MTSVAASAYYDESLAASNIHRKGNENHVSRIATFEERTGWNSWDEIGQYNQAQIALHDVLERAQHERMQGRQPDMSDLFNPMILAEEQYNTARQKMYREDQEQVA